MEPLKSVLFISYIYSVSIYCLQAFNVVNGDVFKWRFLWPNIAEYFRLKPVEPQDQPLNLEELMKDKEAVWDEIVDKHGLKVNGYKNMRHKRQNLSCVSL